MRRPEEPNTPGGNPEVKFRQLTYELPNSPSFSSAVDGAERNSGGTGIAGIYGREKTEASGSVGEMRRGFEGA